MPYTIRPKSTVDLESLRGAIRDAMTKDGRFMASFAVISVIGPSRKAPVGELHLGSIRLAIPKPYCGQHPGPCPVNARLKKTTRLLEWDDWIEFNALVNDVLDQRHIEADAWSNPREPIDNGRNFYFRRGLKRRTDYAWEVAFVGGHEVRVWNHGDESQFEEC